MLQLEIVIFLLLLACMAVVLLIPRYDNDTGFIPSVLEADPPNNGMLDMGVETVVDENAVLTLIADDKFPDNPKVDGTLKIGTEVSDDPDVV